MKIGEGQDVTPEGSSETNFFSQFMPDAESGLLQDEGNNEDEGEESNDDQDGQDDQDDSQETNTDRYSDEEGGQEESEDSQEDESSDDSNDDDESDESDQADSSDVGSYKSMMQNLVDNQVFDITDDNKNYTPDEEGFKKLVEDTVDHRIEKALEDKMSSRSEEIIEIESFLNENEGATIEDYMKEKQEFDYNTVDETNSQHAVYLLEDFYKLQGYKPDEIKDTLKEHQQTKSIGRHAKKAKAALVKYQEEALQTKKEAREARISQERAEAVEENRKLEQKILKSESIGGIKLSPKKRQELADYILKPVNEGKQTKIMLDEVEREDASLLYALIMKDKINLSKLERSAETKATINFKKNINKHTDRMAKPNKSKINKTRSAADGDLSGLDSWRPLSR